MEVQTELLMAALLGTRDTEREKERVRVRMRDGREKEEGTEEHRVGCVGGGGGEADFCVWV